MQHSNAAPQLAAEHLLLGLVREGQGAAMTILRDLGVDPEQVRARTHEFTAK